MLFLFSPLEQFTVYKFISLSFFNNDFSFTNSSLFAFLVFMLLFLLLNSICSNSKLIPTNWQLILENIYEFIFYGIVSENIKKEGSLYFPALFCIFFFPFIFKFTRYDSFWFYNHKSYNCNFFFSIYLFLRN